MDANDPFKNNWKTVDKKEVYDNPWISVSHREVINPSGNPGIYGVVEFKNIAVGIVALDEEDNTFLVGQYRYTLNAYSWEIPEGGCPKHEDPLDAAKRELKEETGLIAHKWETLLEIHTSNSVTDEYGICFLATELEQGEADPEDTEDLMLKKLPLEEAVAMVMTGQITDSLSIASLMKVQLLVEQNHNKADDI